MWKGATKRRERTSCKAAKGSFDELSMIVCVRQLDVGGRKRWKDRPTSR